MAKDLTEALRLLTEQGGAGGGGAPLKVRGEAPAQKSAALNAGKSSGGATGPFIEIAYTNRLWHNQRTTQTPDGLFTVAWKPLKGVTMLDGNGQTVVFTYQDAP